MPGYANPPVESASSVSFIPSGNISSTTVQEAITELEEEKIYREDAEYILINQMFR